MSEPVVTVPNGTGTFLFYRLVDGTFTGRSYVGPVDRVEAKTPAGCGAIQAELVTDWQSQKIDTGTGNIVDWQPPAPEASDTKSWTWDATARRWTSIPTIAARWQAVRAERDRRLAQTDWIALRGLERGDPIPKAWRDYRQALRDVPTQPDPDAIVWPQPPE